MTKFGLEISSGNAAFTKYPLDETARILKDIAFKLEGGINDGFCIDINGNKVGEWYIQIFDEDEEAEQSE